MPEKKSGEPALSIRSSAETLSSEQKKEPESISVVNSIPPKIESSEKSPVKTTRTTVNLGNLLKVDPKKDQQSEKGEAKVIFDEPFTPEQLRAAWMEFAEQRKNLQVEYRFLLQAYELRDKHIIMPLLHPVQETMLAAMKTELTAHLREKLRNSNILVIGELQVADDKKMMYTASDKFKYLAEKNPILVELKERLGLDTDF